MKFLILPFPAGIVVKVAGFLEPDKGNGDICWVQIDPSLQRFDLW
jgi:hypothetical protein